MKQLKEIYEETMHCNKCGFCQATCPIYEELRDEGYVARGRVRLVRAVADGDLQASSNYAHKLFRCLSCIACNIACPSGVKVDAILQAAREDLHQRGLVPPPLLALADTVSSQRNITGEDNALRLVWSQNLARSVQPPGQPESAETVYFVGCVSSFFPTTYRLPQAFIQVLAKAGEGYAVLGGEEWCCGYPLWVAGLTERVEELARHNLAEVQRLGARRLVTTCPSCLRTWVELYPRLLGEELSFEVIHSTQVLDELIQAGKLELGELDMQVTYHDPCDLGRQGEIYEAPRRVIQAIPGVELKEMARHHENSLCCGGGGNMQTYDAELSARIGTRRLRQARDTGAKVLLSACQQCERTLAAAARAETVPRSERIRVMDVVELVWQSTQARGGPALAGD